MTNHLRNNKGFADIVVMGAVLAVFWGASILFIPHKAEEPKKVVNQGVSGDTVSAETK